MSLKTQEQAFAAAIEALRAEIAQQRAIVAAALSSSK
jgi:hypothetical protein